MRCAPTGRHSIARGEAPGNCPVVFDMDMDEDDIESYFTPTVKIFKSGKQYIMRVNVSQRIGSPPLKIYDENEMDVEMDSINENTPMITILEIQGIRCSAKSFQIDVELKQIMVMKPVNLFEKCIIKSKEKDLVKRDSEEPPNEDLIKVSSDTIILDANTELLKNDSANDSVKDLSKDLTKDLSNDLTNDLIKDESTANEPIMDEIENLELTEDNTDDILEINFDVDEIENSETIHLKEKTEVYYQMYREARQKAKLAKSLALSSYLEARRIKNLYMLEDIDDSDESDLEDLEN